MAAKGTTTKAASTKAASERAEGASTVTQPLAGGVGAPVPANDATKTLKGDVVKAAHEAIANANARKAETDERFADMSDEQRDKAAANLAEDEEAKARAGNTSLALPDPDPSVPLTREEQEIIGKARQVIAQVDDPNLPPLTDEAKQRLADAEDQPPAPTTLPIATPGASATNIALMRNDVDVTKTPPFGVGNRADLQG